MSLFVSSLNSGSNGNCYYIGTLEEGVLIDAGISCKEIEKRMKRLGLNIKKIKGVFITHEHSDHIFGISTLSKKYKIPVYITERTLRQAGLKLTGSTVISFETGATLSIGELSVISFSMPHDAADPHNFMISNSKVRIGIFTDVGNITTQVVQHFSQCHAAFLESNYDEQRLESGPYPYLLKDRIRGGRGHLSNSQALNLFLRHRPAFMSHLFLSHLSRVNNSPKIVRELFLPHAGPTEIVIAPRNKETRLYHIRHLDPGMLQARVNDRLDGQLTLFS